MENTSVRCAPTSAVPHHPATTPTIGIAIANARTIVSAYTIAANRRDTNVRQHDVITRRGIRDGVNKRDIISPSVAVRDFSMGR